MKKTLTINLGGIVFNIDEDAYVLLSGYLENLARHFGKQEGAKDILNDIESRMAEILCDQQTETKQVITIEDVSSVIAIMGNPIEIDQETQTNFPEADDIKGPKRFFRNPDQKVIAGVCSGIASYFHLDPVWVRLIFFVFILAGGSGVLLYLLLWVVIPEAQTTSEKLEMHGKKINIKNIEKSIRVEVSELGARVGTIASESAATIRRAGSGSGTYFEMAGKIILSVLKVFFKGLVILSGVIMVITGIGLLLALVAFTLGWTGSIYTDYAFTILSFPRMAGMMAGCDIPVVYLQLIVLVVLGIPLFMVFYNGLRMVIRFERIRHFGLTMFNIWIVGLFFLAWAGMRIYNMNKVTELKQIEIPLEMAASDTLNIMLMADDPGLKYILNEKYLLMGDQTAIISS